MASQLTQSDSIESTHPELELDDQASRIYVIYRRPFRRHYEVKSVADQLLYYGELSSFRRGKPDLTLHRGASVNAPVIAASKINMSGHFQLALGDPNDLNNVQWEDTNRASWAHQQYRFEMKMSGPNDSTYNTERRSFIWKRTRSVGIDDTDPSWSPRNFKLMDEKTGELVAVFTNKRSIGQCGKLQIKEEHGDWFDTMILLSYMSLYEKFDRRNRQRAAAAGGGS
ncbi:hypothetical protein N7488_001045 [Penicillium malachiteum]|nr:hypothetical protein N7488_001045 [Penicillium malachiteum]